MAMSIKNAQVEKLAREIAGLTGESMTQAIRTALEERRQRLQYQTSHQHRRELARDFLEREVWLLVPDELLSRPSDHDEEERILGYGPEGV